jgi:hypothetical protein
MGMLEYLLGWLKMINAEEMVKEFVHYLKIYLITLSAWDEKFLKFVI